ncbi:ATP/GTP-binding protein [Streptomyces misionensis]|uniref:ATP/GTP-binding protein n=1 Tax=Streptomyces misionensis TaxID=67331 RepID=UPI003407B860
MSEETGDTRGQLLNFPTPGDVLNQPPQLADPGRLFPDMNERADIPPESPEEITMELPPIPASPDPAIALRSEGISAPESGDGDGEYEEGEYVQPRSLADRLGDWLEHRLEMARDRHASEAPFREAEIARKTALLEARTAQETAMMEQNGKLHTALMKAKADKAAARGKADAARSSSSGLGADKGGRSKAGGGSSGGGSGRGGTGGGRGSGTNGPGGTGRGSGGGNSPKGTGKGSDRSAGGRGGGSKGNESSGGSKGRQNGSGGSGSGNSGSGKGSPGGSGRNGSGGSGSGKGGRTQNSPASSPRAERSRGRQERAAARQAARQERRSADQAASLADRSKDRDQDRANRQAEREERRAAKAERKAARKAKREAAKAAEDRTTFGEAVAEEAQRRWDKRRAEEKAARDDKAKDSISDKDSEAAPKATPEDDKEKVDLSKGKDGKAQGSAQAPADGPEGGSAPKEPDDGEKPSDGSGNGAGDAEDRGDKRSFGERIRDKFSKSDPPFSGDSGGEPRQPDDRFGWEWPGREAGKPKSEPTGDDIWDAVIVDDPADPFRATVSRPASLPRAPEPHTQRPGTTRPTAQEDPVASEVSKTASGQAGLAAQHRTDITFDEYLMEIVNIAVAAGLDKERAQDLAVALGKVADALRDMATDLVGDHNIATEVVDQITDLADAATRMKQLAERCAIDCELASEAARVAAMAVGRVYGEDIQAMDDAGLAHASSAAHHD